jgi:energy-coupling factor transport system ATP-binding protein
MQELDIAALADRLPTSLSGGEQQRVAIASIFARQPAVFVMDEATTQLDPQGCDAIHKLVSRFKAMGKTIVMVEPKPDKVSQYADSLLILQEGSLISKGTVREVLNSGAYEAAGLGLPSYPSLARALVAKGMHIQDLPITLTDAFEMVERVRHESN